MTDKQKQAVELLNRLHGQGPKAGELLTDEEYYFLLDFIIGEQPQQQITYVPYTPDITPHWPCQPIMPLYQTTSPGDFPQPYQVTCVGEFTQTSTFSVHNDKKEG